MIVAGRINSPELAEAIIQEGRVDAVAMGRPLVADPELPTKAFKGRMMKSAAVSDAICVSIAF